MQRERAGTDGDTAGRQVKAWDLPTRLFHWALVLLVILAYVSRRWGDEGLVWHTWNGIAILVLVVWRLLWGIVGSSTSRFARFVAWPWTAARYGIDFLLRRPRRFLGHNPLGGLAVLALLGLVGAMGVLGLFSFDGSDPLEPREGPLAGRVAAELGQAATDWHKALFDVLLAVVGLHVAAQVLYLVWQRENLVRAMFTGRKAEAAYEDEASAEIAGGGRAVACLVAAIVIVLGGIWLAGGKIL